MNNKIIFEKINRVQGLLQKKVKDLFLFLEELKANEIPITFIILREFKNYLENYIKFAKETGKTELYQLLNIIENKEEEIIKKLNEICDNNKRVDYTEMKSDVIDCVSKIRKEPIEFEKEVDPLKRLNELDERR
jgi:hypothetical protein